MDNIFEMLRERLSMKEVVRFYGVDVNRSNKACCTFHPDKNPSLHIYDDHYYCFGCGAHGDVTDFTAKLFDLTQYEAAKKLDSDFGLYLTGRNLTEKSFRQITPEAEYRRWLIRAGNALNTYLNRLYQWQTKYKPRKPDEELHPLFLESLKQREYTEYLYDMIQYGSESEQREVYAEHRDTVNKIIERIKRQDICCPAVRHKTI